MEGERFSKKGEFDPGQAPGGSPGGTLLSTKAGQGELNVPVQEKGRSAGRDRGNDPVGPHRRDGPGTGEGPGEPFHDPERGCLRWGRVPRPRAHHARLSEEGGDAGGGGEGGAVGPRGLLGGCPGLRGREGGEGPDGGKTARGGGAHHRGGRLGEGGGRGGEGRGRQGAAPRDHAGVAPQGGRGGGAPGRRHLRPVDPDAVESYQ